MKKYLSKKMEKRLLSMVLVFILGITQLCISTEKTKAENITGFEMTAQEMVDDMGVGWNLGNTLDSAMNSWGNETTWGNPYTTKAMIDEVRKAGFKTIRIPITWTYKTSGSPNYIINTTWMDRAEEVVNYALDNGMYVILNTHHENANIVPSYAKQEECSRMVSKIWTQIAQRFEKYGGNLIFEVLNEPRVENGENEWNGATAEVRDVVNKYNQAALDAIRATGGNNELRKVMIPTVSASMADSALADFVVPDDSNVIVSIHGYAPYSFAMEYPGTSTWGTDSEKAAIDWQMMQLYDKFVSKGIAVVIGEFGTINKDNLDARVTHAAYYVKKARQFGITCVWWDNGVGNVGAENYGLLDRRNLTWYFPEIVNAMITSEGSTSGNAGGIVTDKNNLLGNWQLEDYNGNAVKESADVLKINSVGTENWQPHYYQEGLTIEKETPLIFTCTLKCSIDREISILFQRPDFGWETLVLQNVSLKAGEAQTVKIFVPGYSEDKTGVKATVCMGAINGVSNYKPHTIEMTDTSLTKVITEEPEPSTTSANLEINGCQISTTTEGFRVVYSVNDPDNEVLNAGLVYGLAAPDSDMVVGSSNSSVFSYQATDEGKSNINFSSNANAQSYVMTMKFIKNAAFYNSEIVVRGYIQLKDERYVYSDIKKFTIYEIAEYLYQNGKMSNLYGHEYLYNDILYVVNPNYTVREFDLNNSLVEP